MGHGTSLSAQPLTILSYHTLSTSSHSQFSSYFFSLLSSAFHPYTVSLMSKITSHPQQLYLIPGTAGHSAIYKNAKEPLLTTQKPYMTATLPKSVDFGASIFPKGTPLPSRPFSSPPFHVNPIPSHRRPHHPALLGLRHHLAQHHLLVQPYRRRSFP